MVPFDPDRPLNTCDHCAIREYQIEANTATERAIAGRKRQMLIAMATGTGKMFTLVNQHIGACSSIARISPEGCIDA